MLSEDDALRVEKVNTSINDFVPVFGKELFALDKDWFANPSQAPLECPLNNVVWISNQTVLILEEWFGPLMLKRAVILSTNPLEMELEPTFSRIDILTQANEPVVGSIAEVSASEGIPTLVRKIIDALPPPLNTLDEEDVRLWIKQGKEFKLCSCDVVKANSDSSSASLQEEYLEEEEEEDSSLSLMSVVLGATTTTTPLSFPLKRQELCVLLEQRNDQGKWKSEFSEVRSPGPKKRLTRAISFSASAPVSVGQFCDALRVSDQRWLEAVITQLVNPLQVKVHFLSFPRGSDEILTIADQLAPPHSKVPDWRAQMKVGDVLDLHYRTIKPRIGGSVYFALKSKLSSSKSAWLPCTVRKVEQRNKEDPQVFVSVKLNPKYFAAETLVRLSLYSEQLAMRHTHVPRPKSISLGPQNVVGPSPFGPGLVGLRNLGNTCYMNSVLQCLSASEVLRNHFISNQFERDINRKNPLGMGGQLAEAFARVMTELWSNSFSVVSPNKFKQILGQMNSQFQGTSQHDSQELLTQLLDCLHEDLNRVVTKPITTCVESEGKTDLQVFTESWQAFQSRNDSKIVDELYGMMKSHLSCPVCDKQAITFDAYANVSVPIPCLSLISVSFLFVRHDMTATRCVATLPKRAPAKELVLWLEKEFSAIEKDSLLVGDVVGNKVGTYFIRPLVSGSTFDQEDVLENATVRDLFQARALFVFEVGPVLVATTKQIYPDFESCWKVVIADMDKLPVQESYKDFVQTRLIGLGFPYPFAQVRLSKALSASKRKASISQGLARDACKLAEEMNFSVLSDLSKLVATKERLISSVVSDSSDISVEKRKASTKFGTFLSRLKTAPPQVKSPQSSTLQSSSEILSPPAVICDEDAIFVVELNHFKPGARSSRPPSFVRVPAECTWGDLFEEITLHLRTLVSQKIQFTEIPNQDWFVLELEDKKPFPFGPLPLLDYLPASVNALNIVVRWQPGPVGEAIFSTVDSNQLEQNEHKVNDSLLGLGQVQLHTALSSSSSSESAISLQQCLDAFRLREQLGEADTWYCDKCKEHRRAFKTMDLWSTPNILVIHLKRFLYEKTFGERVQREKLNELVEFPVQDLAIRGLNGVEKNYDLFAVSSHMGGLGGGHYVAYVKSDATNSWWLMNDGLVSKVSDMSEVVSNSAYVLFYKCKS